MNQILKILHLEDDPISAELVKERLLSDGLRCEITLVDTREDYLTKLESHDFDFDIVLADYSLPSFDGLSALAMTTERYPDLPYIFVTGQMGEEIAVDSLKKGATDYVMKDNLARLYPAVTRALNEVKVKLKQKIADHNLRKLNRIYSVLSAGNHLIIRSSNREMLFEGACRILVEEGLFIMSWIGLVDESTNGVKPVAFSGFDDEYLKCIKVSLDASSDKSNGPTGSAVRKGRYFFNNDTENDPSMLPWRDKALKHNYHSSAAFPLMFDGKAIGALTVYSCERFFFDDKELKLLDAFAADISFALKSMEQEKLRRIAESGRRDAEAAADELSDKLQSLVEDAFVGVYILQNNKFVYVNQRLADMLGYHVEELLMLENAYSLVHPDDKNIVQENIRKRIDGEIQNLQYEFRALKKNGDVVFVEVLSSYTIYHMIPSIIGSIIDISTRKELEQQKSDMYAMITHDFKGPLTIIMGYSDLIITTMANKVDFTVLDMIKDIQFSSVKLLHMIDEFLSLSKLESAKLSLNLLPMNIFDIVKKVSKDLKTSAADKGLSIIEAFTNGNYIAMIDQMLLYRATANLLQNAINYTPSGGTITLKIGIVTSNKETDNKETDHHVMISVTDTGPGISSFEREKIFDKYYRSSKASKTKGSGLGLAIVKTVAEAHKGKVELESEEGNGSTFKLFIPCCM
ncbi:MAG: GAF domain-containing protein [Oligoflexia bacterium]|nr:GAF domain-containing protein [Oligoflexia bacterium]